MAEKLIVFDLDHTLWPFHVEFEVAAPFTKSKSGVIRDATGAIIESYPDSTKVLELLTAKNYRLGIASRTGEIPGANQLITFFDWDKFFQYREIYPGSKLTHFARLKSNSKIDYCNMIFFDDEERNIRDVSRLGVKCVFVRNGITENLVRNAIDQVHRQ